MKISATIFSLVLVSLVLVSLTMPLAAQSIDGDWKITSGEFAGTAIATEALSAMSLKVTRGNFDAKSGESQSSGKVTFQSGSTPAQMTFTIQGGDDANREIKAIYQLNSTNLKIAFSKSGNYPTNFQTTKENNVLLLTYKNNSKKPVASAGRNRNRRKVKLTPSTIGQGR